MYILATHFPNYWENTNEKIGKYPVFMVQVKDELIPYSRCIFLQLNDKREVVRGWIGHVRDIWRDEKYVNFVPILEEKLSTNELVSFSSYNSGWFAIQDDDVEVATKNALAVFAPPFLETLETTENATEFEGLVYFLLRIIGIHRIYKFPPLSQAGRADGFFKFMHLSVLYDCTLQTDFESVKEQQIENFYNLMLEGVIQVGSDEIERVHRHYKQVWIITRGRTRLLQTVGDFTRVLVKEVAIQDLVDIYFARLTQHIYEERLEFLLRNLEPVMNFGNRIQ